jgi:hypothetical protein
MHKNLHKNSMGNFSGGYYWSSSEYGHNTARAQNFTDGFQEQAYLKTSLKEALIYSIENESVLL